MPDSGRGKSGAEDLLFLSLELRFGEGPSIPQVGQFGNLVGRVRLGPADGHPTNQHGGI